MTDNRYGEHQFTVVVLDLDDDSGSCTKTVMADVAEITSNGDLILWRKVPDGENRLNRAWPAGRWLEISATCL